uniref:Cytochrome c biogenesis protein CcsA n=1 Tax=Schizymenia dubyi TaxID=38368 RepID=A0A1C9C9B5_9FLOR|nr:cytochrome c biogenesis protein [Schizymenia dubyi]AOM64962.1 cytochrome c biogenesis protein [Schizymenia dubyi]
MNWTVIENNLINLSFAALFITLILYWLNLAFPNLTKNIIICKLLTIFTNLCLSIFLSLRWINHGYFPLSNLYESLIFLTWSLTTVHLIIEQKSKSKLVGSISTPVALFTIAFASLTLPIDMKKAEPLVPALKSNWLMMHVSIMMLSYAALILGSLLSILFLIITKGKNVNLKNIGDKSHPKSVTLAYQRDQTLKINNSLLSINRMNLLQSVDNLSYRIIGLGFPLLTIGIISGAVWANEAWGSYWSWDPKETWALITWLVYAAYLHSRLTQSWRGQKPAILASLGFITVWICYLGVNFLGKGLHSYGWIL